MASKPPLSVTMDDASYRRLLDTLGAYPKAVRNILKGAVGDTAKVIRTRVYRRMAQTITLPVMEIRKSVRVERLPDTPKNAAAKVNITDHQHKLHEFRGNPRQPRPSRYGKTLKSGRRVVRVRKPPTYQIEKAGPKKTIPTGFVARAGFGEGTVNIFRRRGDPRYPLVFLRGPSVAVVFASRTAELAQELDFAAEHLAGRIDARLILTLEGRMNRTLVPTAAATALLADLGD